MSNQGVVVRAQKVAHPHLNLTTDNKNVVLILWEVYSWQIQSSQPQPAPTPLFISLVVICHKCARSTDEYEFDSYPINLRFQFRFGCVCSACHVSRGESHIRIALNRMCVKYQRNGKLSPENMSSLWNVKLHHFVPSFRNRIYTQYSYECICTLYFTLMWVFMFACTL